MSLFLLIDTRFVLTEFFAVSNEFKRLIPLVESLLPLALDDDSFDEFLIRLENLRFLPVPSFDDLLLNNRFHMAFSFLFTCSLFSTDRIHSNEFKTI